MESTRSLLIEQQMQPLLSCTMLSSVAMISSLSIPISPISLTMTPILRSCWFAKTWFSSVVFPLPRKPAMTVTGSRALSLPALIGREGVGCADSRLTDPFTECIGERVQRSPARAVPSDDVFDGKRPQALDGVRNARFHHTAQMQPAHDAGDRKIAEQLSHLATDIDNTGMRAGAEDNQT